MDSLSHKVYKSLEIKKWTVRHIYRDGLRIQKEDLLCPSCSFVSFKYLYFLSNLENLRVMD